MTGRENMELVWQHKQPEWVPMINTDAQMIITPVLTPMYEIAQELSDTHRDQGGFGSTGK